LRFCECIREELENHSLEISAQDWIDVKEKLPPCNVLVKVILTNGIESFDFVNEPINTDIPFQHYRVSNWRMATTDELNKFIRKANQ